MEKLRFLRQTQRIRKAVLTAVFNSKKGHIGGALSCVDILWALYANGIVDAHPGGPMSSASRPLILSKGHSATALLATLCELELAPCTLLQDYNRNGSLIGSNPSELIIGIELHAGSLGHGIGFASGIALGRKVTGDGRRVTVLVSDGELHEGSSWEGIMFAAHHNLNLTICVDYNNQICEDHLENVVKLESLSNKLNAFGFKTVSLSGHEYEDLKEATSVIDSHSGPTAVVFNTIKGKGVSFMERVTRFHHSIPTEYEYSQAMMELSSD